MNKLERTTKELEKKLNKIKDDELTLKIMLKEKQDREKILNTIDCMKEREKIILTRICINGETPQVVGQDLGLKQRQVYNIKNNSLKSLLDRLCQIKELRGDNKNENKMH